MKKISTYAVGWILSVCLLIANTVSAQSVTIGTGTSTQRYPLGNYFGYERSASIYLASEIGTTGSLVSLAWYATTTQTDARPIKVYLSTTTATALSSDTWANETAGATLVCDTSFAPVVGWNTINLSSAFPYNGTDNLLVLVEANYGGSGVSVSGGSGVQYTNATSQHEYWYQDNSEPTDDGSVTNRRPNIQINYIPAPACSGVPVAGTATLSANSGNPGSTFTTTISGSTFASALTYQWQKSADGSTGWTDISGATAQNSSLTAENTLGSTTYYRLKSTCTNTNDSAFSNTVSYAVAITYCTPPAGGSSTSYYFDSINSLDGLTNLNYTASVYKPYVDSSASLFSQYAGGVVNVYMAAAGDATCHFYGWVDWNGDGDFDDADEAVFAQTTYEYNYTGTINISASQAVGSYRVRFGVIEAGTLSSACSDNEYGNYVDYTLNIPATPTCSGVPVAGTVTVSPTEYSAGTPYTAVATGYSLSSGLTFQWQTNTDGTGWADSGASLTIYADYTGTIPVFGSHIDNRLIVTCGSSGLSDTSTVATVTSGYCGSPLSNTANGVDIITNVVVTNSLNVSYSNASTSNGTDNYDIYNNTPVDLYVGTTTNQLALTFGTDGTQYSVGWIDFDHNGVFDSTENIALATSSASGGATATYTFTVPSDAVQGVTRMRVRGGSDDAYSATGACDITSYGETEDYNVNITTIQTCTGTPAAGTVVANPSVGLSGTAVSVASTGFTAGEGLSYQWQSNTNGAGWVNEGTSDTVYSALTVTAAASADYRLIVNCVSSSESDTSEAATFTLFNNGQIVPASGNNSIACGSNTMLFDNGGSDGDYASNSNGYTVLNAGSVDAVVSISGSYATEGCCDAINIYDGADNSGTLLQSFQGTGTINYTGNPGETLTVEFTSDFSGEYAGFALAVTYTGTCYNACSGAPVAGTVSVSPTQNGAGTTYSASATGYSLAGSLSFQWQSNTDSAGWVSVGASDTTYADLNGLVSGAYGSTAQYRLIVTCTVSGVSDTSSSATFTSGYCLPVSSIDNEVGVTLVTLGTLLNNASTGDPGYSDYTNIPVTVYIGQTYPLSVEVDDPDYDGVYAKAWIDWNQNGDFSDDNSELDLSDSYGSGPTYNSPMLFTIPTVTPGAYRMRIRATREYDDNYDYQEPTSCGDQDYSEAEDYMLNIQPYASCSGTPTAGTIVFSPVSAGVGETYDVSATGYTEASGLSFQWQSNTGNAGWVNEGATDTVPNTYTATATAFGDTVLWRLVVTCTNSSTSDTTASVFVVGYCSPTSDDDDGTGITNVIFAGISNPSTGDPAYTDYSNISATAVIGQTYPLTVNVNTEGSWTVNVYAWVDWNQNGDFTDEATYLDLGSAYDVTDGPTSASPLSVIIPNVTPGAYRVRIRAAFGASTTPTPCGAEDWSEAEDYTLNIVAPAPTISSFTPANGCANTSTVVITGTDFSGVTAVTIGGTAASSFVVNSSTQITANIGSGTTGVVSVTTASGTATTTDVFTVNTPATTTQSFTLCAGESVTVGSHTYNASGTYHDTLQTTLGCDSIVTTTLNINDAINTSVNVAGVTATAVTANATYQWINCANGQAVAGATAQSFTATTSGSYSVAITVGACSDTSTCVNLTPSGIKDIDWSKAINIYPNPTTGVATISITNFDASDLIITITDVQGQVVFQSEENVHSSNYSTTINLSNVAKGVYLVKLNTGNSFAVKQLVLQ